MLSLASLDVFHAIQPSVLLHSLVINNLAIIDEAFLFASLDDAGYDIGKDTDASREFHFVQLEDLSSDSPADQGKFEIRPLCHAKSVTLVVSEKFTWAQCRYYKGQGLLAWLLPSQVIPDERRKRFTNLSPGSKYFSLLFLSPLDLDHFADLLLLPLHLLQANHLHTACRPYHIEFSRANKHNLFTSFIFSDNELAGEVLFQGEDVLKLGECCAGPPLEEWQVLEEIHKLVLVFDLDLLEDAFEDVLGDHSKVAICQAFDSCGTRVICDQGQLPKRLS
jgi:hypothetical protein